MGKRIINTFLAVYTKITSEKYSNLKFKTKNLDSLKYTEFGKDDRIHGGLRYNTGKKRGQRRDETKEFG